MNLTPDLGAPVARVSLADVVYDRLLEAIVAGQFAAGDELNEVALSQRFQVSRTPVREALGRLVADGLVQTARNKRATVVDFSRREVQEAYQVRLCLESGAAYWAAERITPATLETLRASADRCAPESHAEWREEAKRFDTVLHRAIAEASGNQRLANEIARYGHLVPLMQRLVGRNASRLELAWHEHIRILTALEARDANAARDAMAAHIQSALQAILEDLALT